MRFWHLTLHSLGLRSNKGSLRLHLDSSQFFRLLLRLKVFRSITLKYLYDFVGCFRTKEKSKKELN